MTCLSFRANRSGCYDIAPLISPGSAILTPDLVRIAGRIWISMPSEYLMVTAMVTGAHVGLRQPLPYAFCHLPNDCLGRLARQ